MLGIEILVHPANVQEIPLPREAPAAYVRRLARDKARAVPGELVLGADTTVVLDDALLEKPRDAKTPSTCCAGSRAGSTRCSPRSVW